MISRDTPMIEDIPYAWYCNLWLQLERSENPWWRHQMKTFSALLAICAGNSPDTIWCHWATVSKPVWSVVTALPIFPCEFATQRPVTRSFGVFFDLRLNKRLSKQSWGWWFETLSRSLWRHCNAAADTWTSHCYSYCRSWLPLVWLNTCSLQRPAYSLWNRCRWKNVSVRNDLPVVTKQTNVISLFEYNIRVR